MNLISASHFYVYPLKAPLSSDSQLNTANSAKLDLIVRSKKAKLLKVMENNGRPLRQVFLWVLFLSSIFYLNFTSRVILSPLLPFVEKDLHTTHTKAGALFLLLSLGYCISMLLSGFFAKKVVHRKVIFTSAVGVGAVLIFLSFTRTFAELSLLLIALGLLSGLYLPSGLSTITRLVRKEDWGKAISLHEWAPNLAFITAPLIVELFTRHIPWRGIFLIIGTASLTIGVVYYRFGKGGEFHGESPNPRAVKRLIKNRNIWAMLFIFGLGIGGTIGIYNMLPLFLTSEKHFPSLWVNTIVSLSKASGLVATLVSGWLTDRIGPRKTIALVFVTSGVSASFLGFFNGKILVALIFLQSLFATCFFPPGFSALSSITGERERNLAVSFTIPFAFVLGAGVIPSLIGFFGDKFSFAYGFLLVGFLTLLGISLLGLLKKPSPSAK